MTTQIAMRRIPVIPTIIVIAAAATMVMLGFWQLDRKDQKEAQIAQYAAASDQALIDPIPIEAELESILYRRGALNCAEVLGWSAIAGRNDNDQSGYVQIARCRNGDWAEAEGAVEARFAEVVLGWSRDPSAQPDWRGGAIEGIIAPGGDNGWRIIADQPVGVLQANAAPDPGDLPNNHLAYAGQWFFFALTALVIYWFALRSRWRDAA